MTENERTLLLMLFDTTWQLRWSSLSHPSGRAAELVATMNNPEPGDWVLEMSTQGASRLKGREDERFGRLVLKRKEWVAFTDDEGGYWEEYTYVEGLDGRLHRWHNCNFCRVLDFWLDKDTTDREAKAKWAAGSILRHGLEGVE